MYLCGQQRIVQERRNGRLLTLKTVLYAGAFSMSLRAELAGVGRGPAGRGRAVDLRDGRKYDGCFPTGVGLAADRVLDCKDVRARLAVGLLVGAGAGPLRLIHQVLALAGSRGNDPVWAVALAPERRRLCDCPTPFFSCLM